MNGPNPPPTRLYLDDGAQRLGPPDPVDAVVADELRPDDQTIGAVEPGGAPNSPGRSTGSAMSVTTGHTASGGAGTLISTSTVGWSR
ncbi:hypothetical protein [Gordonia defluvii]|uniref:hypothetical protein n=1 Tax=Gordonia defluvii TaxID=283718 RepID=UPI0031DA635B